MRQYKVAPEAEEEYPCPFKVPTGDERYPVLCAHGGRFGVECLLHAGADYCKDCRYRYDLQD